MATTVYDLNGVGLAVDSADAGLAAFLDPLLSRLRTSGSRPCHWQIRLDAVSTLGDVPVGVPIWDGSLPEGMRAVFYDADLHQELLAPDRFRILHSRRSNVTSIAVLPDGRRAIAGTAVFWMLDRILAAAGRYLLHGACLVVPDGTALIVFAPSGTGKTTTALALARHGLALAGDDAIVLENRPERSLVWAIPRRPNVHRRTAALLPWLAPALADWRGDEQSVALDLLGTCIATHGPQPCPIAGVVVLQPPNGDGHRIAPLSKPAALTAIATDNLRRSARGVLTDDQAAFAALGRLIGRVPVAALSVGPDPDTLRATMLLDALGPTDPGR